MWYITVDGKQIPLHVRGEENAEAARHAAEALTTNTLTSHPIATPSTQAHPFGQVSRADRADPSNPLLSEAVERFVHRLQHRIKKRTLTNYRQFLDLLVKSFPPDTRVRDVRPEQLERLADRPSWSPSTRHDALGVWGVFFRDAGHPLRLRRPPKESRGADAVWTEQEFWQVYGAALGDLKPLLLVLRETGCRPSEVTYLTVENIDWEHGCCRLKDHKNAQKGKQRVIHFPSSVMRILEHQRQKYKSGPLFYCAKSGCPFNGRSLGDRLRRARQRAGVKRIVTAYGLRHWYCTRALESGLSNEQVAALVGNSAAMIEKHYGHLSANARLMRQLAEQVSSGRVGQ